MEKNRTSLAWVWVRTGRKKIVGEAWSKGDESHNQELRVVHDKDGKLSLAHYNGRWYSVKHRYWGREIIVRVAKDKKEMKRKKDRGTKEGKKNMYKDKAYVAHIKGISCLMFGRNSDPHHVTARGWREVKRNDYTCIPLCRVHHAEIETIGPSKFEEEHNINIWEEVSRLAVKYLVERLRDKEESI